MTLTHLQVPRVKGALLLGASNLGDMEVQENAFQALCLSS